jgi:membrane fusion protein (multidrug efflux system)
VLRVQLKDANSNWPTTRFWRRCRPHRQAHHRSGQRVQPGQQLTAIVQENVWLTANFKETQLADMKAARKSK